MEETSKPAVDREKGQPASFGELLRFYRRQCVDPLRGGMLTQERLGELIGEHMGDAGYSGAAVSEWERDKSKIHADDRVVLQALLAVLVRCGGLQHSSQADALLATGNYRRLDETERSHVFGDVEGAYVKSETRQRPDLAARRSSSEPPARREKQLVLLEKVTSFWVEGVLEKSLQGAPKVKIPYHLDLPAIDHPWEELLGPALLEGQEMKEQETLINVYDSADSALLLLGDPGSGKTTTMITLAEALIRRARDDWREPVPVVLDLSSWARMPLKMADWAVEELAAKYQIPRRYSRKWVAANELVLLLDGLDTLPLQARRACMDAINAFRKSHGLSGLVVSCRKNEYEETGQRLKLNMALALDPLSEDQLSSYVIQAGADLDSALRMSSGLRKMARNPLMLNILTSVFSGSGNGGTASEIALNSIGERKLLSAYVERMFTQRPAHPDYPRQRTMKLLSWLAAEMNTHNQTMFLIEKLQPSWLPGVKWRRTYMILSGLIVGFFGGLIMWLLWRLLRHTLPQLPSPTSEFVADLLAIPVSASEPLTIILGNLGLGLLVGATLLWLFERRIGQSMDAATVRRQRLIQMVLISAEAGILTALFVSLFSEPLLGLAWGVAEGFMYGAASRYIFGWNYQTEVRTVEALGWSWSHAATGVLVGVILTVIAEVIETALYGYNGFSRTLATLMTAGFVLGGLRGRSTERKSRPNQGIWLSLRNAFVAALVLSITLAGLAWVIRDPAYAWQIAVLSAIIAAALMGASVFVKHFLLRVMLRINDAVPARYARFLDYAAYLVLLRKVGNGYIFMHGLLQDYFAQHATQQTEKGLIDRQPPVS